MEYMPPMSLSSDIAEVEQGPWQQGPYENCDRSLVWTSESRNVFLAIYLLEVISSRRLVFPLISGQKTPFPERDSGDGIELEVDKGEFTVVTSLWSSRFR